MLAFSNDYYGIIFRATQSVELFCAYFHSVSSHLPGAFFLVPFRWLGSLSPRSAYDGFGHRGAFFLSIPKISWKSVYFPGGLDTYSHFHSLCPNIHHYMGMGEKMYALYPIVQTAPESECKNVPDRVNTPETYFLIKNIGCPL